MEPRVITAARLVGALAETLDSVVRFVIEGRTSIEDTFQLVTSPLANAT